MRQREVGPYKTRNAKDQRQDEDDIGDHGCVSSSTGGSDVNQHTMAAETGPGIGTAPDTHRLTELPSTPKCEAIFVCQP